jgi:L-ribulokinase
VPVRRIVCAGGIAEKNPMLMQIYADVTGREMQISASSQTCALGSAISAAVLAGAYPDFQSAQKAMAHIQPRTYSPNADAQAVYEQLFQLYRKLHDAFGGVATPELGGVMKDLLTIKEAQRR